jgi:hypothetical protein
MIRAAVFLLFVSSAVPGQNPPTQRQEHLRLSPREEKESYDIYSTALTLKEPGIKAWKIIQETHGWDLCSRPKPDQESVYRAMVEDYTEKNRKTLVFQRRFTLPRYSLVRPDGGTWLYDRDIAQFSAVGFNTERTRAAVCLWAADSGTCFILTKSEGSWKPDRDWHGDGCAWAF